jgi:hypothetical protein
MTAGTARTAAAYGARRGIWLRGAAIVVWIVATAVGMIALTAYSNTPGAAAAAPPGWPRESTIRPSGDRPTLLMFLHPRCPCSRASLNEMARLLTRIDPKVDVRCVFFCPANEPPTWAHTDLWRRAAALCSAAPLIDREGREAARFGANTSGHTLLFASTGERIYSGGITISRGHEGDSLGSRTIRKLLRSESIECAECSVFGCPIQTLVSPGA